MKNLIIIAFLMALTYNLLSQDKIDPIIIKDLSNTAIYDTAFGNEHFVRGWNWGSPGRNLDDALYINTKISFILEH